MTFREWWEQVKAANPELNDGANQLVITASEFRQWLRKAHDEGVESVKCRTLWEEVFGRWER